MVDISQLMQDRLLAACRPLTDAEYEMHKEPTAEQEPACVKQVWERAAAIKASNMVEREKMTQWRTPERLSGTG